MSYQDKLNKNWISIFSVRSVSLVNAKCGTCGKDVFHGTIALNENKSNTMLRGSDSYYDIPHHEECSSENEEWKKHYQYEIDEYNDSINKL